MKTVNTVPVSLASNSYDILVGDQVLGNVGEILRNRFGAHKIVVVTDNQVAQLYLPRLRESLPREGYDTSEIIVPAGEGSKSFGCFETLATDMLRNGITRDSLVVALGGGVVGDLAGFAASVVLRGINCIQVPTTLLAQVDSAVGGKTAINTSLGKNLVGSFHQPKLVVADTSLLDTLPERELLAGYAEIVKYGLLGDAEFFEWLEHNGRALIGGDAPARDYAVTTCCQAKSGIVSRDEHESGQRLLLNLGHTFGHALEAEVDFDSRLLHGEAVALGSILAFDLSARLGFCAASSVKRVRNHLRAVGLPTVFPILEGHVWEPERLLDHMTRDKKIRNGKQTLILARDIGDAFAYDQTKESEILEMLHGYVGQPCDG